MRAFHFRLYLQKSQLCAEFCKIKSVVQKIGFQVLKLQKKHNLQKWTLYSSISNSFRDMSNSSNSPFSHVVKIRWEIRVWARKKFQAKKWISASKTSKKHNLQKWDLYSSISNSFRDMSNSSNSPLSHVVKIHWEINVYARKKFQKKMDFRLKNFKKT